MDDSFFSNCNGYFTQYLVTKPLLDPGSSWPMSRVLPKSAGMPAVGNLDSSVFVVGLVFILVLVYVKKGRQGYEMQIMGKNPLFAKVGGCDTDKNFMRAMVYSGALANLAGVIMIVGAGQQNRFLPAIGQSFANDGLMVSIISGNSVPDVIFYALLFSVLQSGSTGMQMDTGAPSEFVTILIAITVFAVAGSCLSGSWVVGILCGTLGSMVISVLFWFFVMKIKAGEFIAGIAINTFALGATTYFLRQIFNVKGSLVDSRIQTLPRWEISIMKDIPIIGTMLSGHAFPLYITILVIVPLVAVLIYKTFFCLRLFMWHRRNLSLPGIHENVYGKYVKRTWLDQSCNYHCYQRKSGKDLIAVSFFRADIGNRSCITGYQDSQPVYRHASLSDGHF